MTKQTPLIGVIRDSMVGTCLEVMDADVVDISTMDDLNVALRYVDGIVLTGGPDVDPGRYQQQRHKETYGVDKWRDKIEFSAVKRAKKAGIPIMGICRGMQLLNVANGGSLNQHIGNHHWNMDYPLILEPKSSLWSINAKSTWVDGSTHLHHQAIDRVGRYLRCVAQAMDGTPEAIESTPDAPTFMIGTQFHPEYDFGIDPLAREIFRLFVEKSRVLASRKKKPSLTRMHKYEDITKRYGRWTSPYAQGGNRGKGSTSQVQGGSQSQTYPEVGRPTPGRDGSTDLFVPDTYWEKKLAETDELEDIEFFRRGMHNPDDGSDMFDAPCAADTCLDPWACHPESGLCLAYELEEGSVDTALMRYERMGVKL